MLALFGAEAQQLGVLDVVAGQVEVVVELLPGPAIVLDLEPDLPLAPVQAGQELGEPGGVDVGAVFSQRRHGNTSLMKRLGDPWGMFWVSYQSL